MKIFALSVSQRCYTAVFVAISQKLWIFIKIMSKVSKVHSMVQAVLFVCGYMSTRFGIAGHLRDRKTEMQLCVCA